MAEHKRFYIMSPTTQAVQAVTEDVFVKHTEAQEALAQKDKRRIMERVIAASVVAQKDKRRIMERVIAASVAQHGSPPPSQPKASALADFMFEHPERISELEAGLTPDFFDGSVSVETYSRWLDLVAMFHEEQDLAATEIRALILVRARGNLPSDCPTKTRALIEFLYSRPARHAILRMNLLDEAVLRSFITPEFLDPDFTVEDYAKWLRSFDADR